MVAKNNLFILFQNQLVEYIHKIQDKILPQQYDSLKQYYMAYKQSDYNGKMTILVDFINNLTEYNHAIIAKDSSIFAVDDIIYGSRDAICFIPNIDFRPFVKINSTAMWDSIQKMYVVANRIVSADPEYSSQLSKNLFDLFVESMTSQQTVSAYKSAEFINTIWKKFLDKLNNDKDLYDFKTKCTNDISVDKLASFVKDNKTTFVKMIKHIIYISNDTFNEEYSNINVFDLRDDLITLLQTADTYITNKDNRMIVKGLLNVAKGIPFFVNLQEDYHQKLDVNGVHVTIGKIIEAANNFTNTDGLLSKVKDLLQKSIAKIEDTEFDKSIEKYIDAATRQVASIIPMLQKISK